MLEGFCKVSQGFYKVFRRCLEGFNKLFGGVFSKVV